MTNQTKGTLIQILGVFLIAIGIGSIFYSQNGGGVWFSILAFFLFSMAAPLLKDGAKIKHLTAEELLKKDKREPILFLRTFRKDNIDIRELTGFAKDNMFSPNYYINKSELTFEEKITEIFNSLGPVVAIGRPNEKKQLLGASRIYISDDEWKDKVKDLALKSSFILLIVDDSPSLRWEFQEMIKLKKLNQLFLIMPPFVKNEDIPSTIKSFLSDMNILQEKDVSKDIVAITFDKNGNIVLIKSKSFNILKRISFIKSYIKKFDLYHKNRNWLYIIIAIILISGLVGSSIYKQQKKLEMREYAKYRDMAFKTIERQSIKNKIVGRWECIQDSSGFSKGNIIEFTENTMNFVFEMPYKVIDSDDSHIIIETTLGDIKVKHFIEILDDDKIIITGALHKRVE